MILATESATVTAKNVQEAGVARLGLGGTRDVVMVEATLETTFAADNVPEAVGATYAEQADWDPRLLGPAYVYLVLRPRRIQAWREADEILGRTVMHDGNWLD